LPSAPVSAGNLLQFDGARKRKGRGAALSSILDTCRAVFYARQVIETWQTPEFAGWFRGLRDLVARGRIAKRIILLEGGHFGDVKSVGDKVSELRIDHGPGYRLYFTWRGEALVLLLIGGDKGSQRRDIAKAKELAARDG
jgi:putative addiction module killer protein